MLLSRVAFSTEEQSNQIDEVKAIIGSQCEDLFESDNHTSVDETHLADINFPSLSWTVKSEISRWVRQAIASRIQKGVP